MNDNTMPIPRKVLTLDPDDQSKYFSLFNLIDRGGNDRVNIYDEEFNRKVTLGPYDFMKSLREFGVLWNVSKDKAGRLIEKFRKLGLLFYRDVEYKNVKTRVYSIFEKNDKNVAESTDSQQDKPFCDKELSDNQPVNIGVCDRSGIFCDKDVSVNQLLTIARETGQLLDEAIDLSQDKEVLENQIVNTLVCDIESKGQFCDKELLENQIVNMGVCDIIILYLIINTHYIRINNIDLSKTSFDDSLKNEEKKLKVILRDEKVKKEVGAKNPPIGSKKVKVVSTEDVEKVYRSYPTKCPVTGKSTGKSSKNKETIRTRIKSDGYTAEKLIFIIKSYTKEVENENFKQMKNFKTFLNNIPDYDENSDEFKLKEGDLITSCGQLDHLKDEEVVTVVKIPSEKQVEMSGDSSEIELNDHIRSIKSNINGGWAIYRFVRIVR